MRNLNQTSRVIIGMMVLLMFASVALAQSQIRKPATASYGAAGCLACPGSEWSDYNYIKKRDGKFATTTLAAESFCFQTICYYSRGLMASAFQFSIPATATITGVRVVVGRKADTVNAVYDYDIQLMKDLLPEGNNKKAAHAWPITVTPKSYGNLNDTWGLALTPDVVNSSGFGFWLQCQNVTDSYRTGLVDFIKMIVYYSTGGKMQEQTSEAGEIAGSLQLYPNPSSQTAQFSIDASKSGNLVIQILDQSGRMLMEETKSAGTGKISQSLDISALAPGNYFVRVELNSRVWIGKLEKQ